MNCGSEIGNASKYNSSLAERKHLCYMGTSQILMPENYIAMFDAPQAEEARKIVKMLSLLLWIPLPVLKQNNLSLYHETISTTVL